MVKIEKQNENSRNCVFIALLISLKFLKLIEFVVRIEITQEKNAMENKNQPWWQIWHECTSRHLKCVEYKYSTKGLPFTTTIQFHFNSLFLIVKNLMRKNIWNKKRACLRFKFACKCIWKNELI